MSYDKPMAGSGPAPDCPLTAGEMRKAVGRQATHLRTFNLERVPIALQLILDWDFGTPETTGRSLDATQAQRRLNSLAPRLRPRAHPERVHCSSCAHQASCPCVGASGTDKACFGMRRKRRSSSRSTKQLQSPRFPQACRPTRAEGQGSAC